MSCKRCRRTFCICEEDTTVVDTSIVNSIIAPVDPSPAPDPTPSSDFGGYDGGDFGGGGAGDSFDSGGSSDGGCSSGD